MRPSTLLALVAVIVMALPPLQAAAENGLEPLEGTWSARIGWGGETLRLRMRWLPASGTGESRADFEIPLEEMEGIVPGDFSRSGAPLSFSWSRKAGTFRFTGEGAWFFRPGGEFVFFPSQEEAARLRELGTVDVDSRALFWMALRDVDPALIQGLADLGYESVRMDDVLRLSRRGIDLGHVQDAQSLGYRPSLDELIQLHARGIEGSYLRAFGENGIQHVPVEDIIRLHARGIDAATMRGMIEAGYGPDRVEDMIRLHTRGVDPGELADYTGMEGGAPTTEEILRLHSRGVKPGMVAEYTGAEGLRPTPEEIIRLHSQGVPADYLLRVAGSGLREPVESAVRLKQRGVDPELFEGLAAMGYTDIEDIITVHSRSIPLRDIQELRELGYTGLDVSDLTRLHDNGVRASFVRRLVEAGYTDLTVEELVEIKRRGEEELLTRRSRP